MKKITQKFLSDFSASIVVFLVALPLCLGVALGSQAPLLSGIIAGIVGGIVVGFLSSSPLSVSGPAAGLIAIVVLALQKLGSFEAFLLAVLIAGIFQIIFGYLKVGSIGDFIPNSVIKGMLAAIGIILIIKQIPHFVGYDYSPEIDGELLENEKTFDHITNIDQHLSMLAIIIGLISIAILLLWERKFFKKYSVFKFIPGPLVAVIVGAAINHYYTAQGSAMALSSDHLVFLPQFKDLSASLFFPDFSAINSYGVWTTAITIALVASIESLLCIEAIDKIDPLKRRTDVNRELKAQGLGNVTSGLLGGLPITSVIVRSSANVDAGAQSKASTIMHGIWILLAVALIPFILNKIPYAALAAILIITGYKLTKPAIFKDLYRLGLDQLLPFLVTIGAILCTNLLLGILIGIIVSFFFIIYSNFRSSIMMVKNSNNHYLLRLRKDTSFLNKAKLKNLLEEIPSNAQVLIDVSRADFIDKDVIEVINDFSKHAKLKHITVEIKRSNFKSLHRLIKGNFKK